MKVVELLEIGGKMLKLMSENDVNRDYFRFVPMYKEFHNMRDAGIKYREAVRILADDYKTSKASIERAIKKLSQEC